MRLGWTALVFGVTLVTAATPVKAELSSIPLLWEELRFEEAWQLIQEQRINRTATPESELFAALSLDFGLGTYRDVHEAGRLYRYALILGENRARQPLADLLFETGLDRAEPQRLWRALRAVQRQDSASEPVSRIGPLQFGLPEARLRNLEFALSENRKIAIESRSKWSVYNVGQLMAYNRRADPETRLLQQRIWEQQALKLAAPATMNLEAFLHEHGIGRVEDIAAAIEALRNAAEQGFQDSQWSLGRRYLNGRGLVQDKEQGIALMKQGALGHADRMRTIARIFHNGEDYPKDMKEALTWYRRAAAAGHAAAASELGRFHEGGWARLDPDSAYAEVSFRQAANRGSSWGMHNLASLLASKGSSGEEDSSGEILFWSELAAHIGNTDSHVRLIRDRDSHRDLKDWNYWIHVGMNRNIKEAYRIGIWQHLFSSDGGGFKQAEAIAWQALHSGHSEMALIHLLKLYKRNGPLHDPVAFDHLATSYWQEGPQLRRQIFRVSLINYPMTSLEELQRQYSYFREHPEEAEFLLLIGLIFLPQLSTNPFADIMQLLPENESIIRPLAEQAKQKSADNPMYAFLDSIADWSLIIETIPEKLPSFAIDDRELQQYALIGGINNPKDILRHSGFPVFSDELANVSTSPQLRGLELLLMLGEIFQKDVINLLLTVRADGRVVDIEVENPCLPIVEHVLRKVVYQWQWEPDPQAKAKTVMVRIPFKFP